MTEELLQQIVTGIPNFAGFTIAIFALLYVIRQKDMLIRMLIERWAECEDDSERKQIAKQD